MYLQIRHFNLLPLIEDSLWKETKSHYILYCPQCNKPKLYVDKKEKVFICFRCNQVGNLVSLIAFLKNISREEAIQYIFNKDIKVDHQLEKKLMSYFFNEEGLRNHFHAYLPRDYVSLLRLNSDHRVNVYVKHRGLTKQDIDNFDLGYSEGTERLVFPFYFNYELVGWQGRDITDTQTPKTMLLSGFDKSKYLYNYDKVKEQRVDSLIITEGPIDCIKSSFLNSVALFGKTISDTQMNLILDLKLQKLYVGLDPDTHCVRVITRNGVSFINLARQFAKKFALFIPEIYIMNLPSNKDIGDLSKDEVQYYVDTAERFKHDDICEFTQSFNLLSSRWLEFC